MYHLYHGEPNTLSLKVLLALHEVGAVFESHWLDFSNPMLWCGEPFSRSRHWNVGVEIGSPLLIDGDILISDSTFIGYYIDENNHVPQLVPDDAYGQWQLGKWARFSAEVLTTAVHTLGCARLSSSSQHLKTSSDTCQSLPQEEQRQQWQQFAENAYPKDLLDDCERRIHLAVTRVESALSETSWLIGKAFSLADIDLFSGLRATSSPLAEISATG